MEQHSTTASSKPKKISNTLIIFVACVLGLGIGLLTINYWHTNNCVGKSETEVDEFLDAFNRRLLEAESLVSNVSSDKVYIGFYIVLMGII